MLNFAEDGGVPPRPEPPSLERMLAPPDRLPSTAAREARSTLGPVPIERPKITIWAGGSFSSSTLFLFTESLRA